MIDSGPRTLSPGPVPALFERWCLATPSDSAEFLPPVLRETQLDRIEQVFLHRVTRYVLAEAPAAGAGCNFKEELSNITRIFLLLQRGGMT